MSASMLCYVPLDSTFRTESWLRHCVLLKQSYVIVLSGVHELPTAAVGSSCAPPTISLLIACGMQVIKETGGGNCLGTRLPRQNSVLTIIVVIAAAILCWRKLNNSPFHLQLYTSSCSSSHTSLYQFSPAVLYWRSASLPQTGPTHSPASTQ